MKDDYVEMSATCFIESLYRRMEHGDWRHNIDEQLLARFFGFEGDPERYAVVDSVRDSHKFYFGSIGYFDHDDYWHNTNRLSETAKEFLKNGIQVMPYSTCWFEWDPWLRGFDWRSWKGDPGGRVACLIEKGVGTLIFQTFYAVHGSDRNSLVKAPWTFSGAVMVLYEETSQIEWWTCGHWDSSNFTAISDKHTGAWDKNSPWDLDKWPDYKKGNATADDWRSVDRCLAAMMILMAKDVKTVERHPPAALNQHRAKKGKVPLFSHHVVTIKPERIVYEQGDGTDANGIKRASPRLHWRRGHVRTLSSGKKVGVPPCIIGAKAGGAGPVIDKTYRVSPT